MTTGTKASARASRAWHGIVVPLVLTCVLAVVGWLFVASVSAEQERLDSDALALEKYARQEAAQLAARSRELVKTLVDNRLAARRSQERSLQLELRGVMDAVYRLLTAGLEKAKANTSVRREVGDFPSGFSGVQNYLEIAAARSGGDQAVAALRACSPELSALLPSGCSLTVVENNFQEHLSLGGGVPENAVSEAMTREFIWDDGGRGRHWTLQVRLSAPDAHPLPDARELAAQLTGELGHTRLERVLWRGWLVDRTGKDVAFFPRSDEGGGAGDGALPFIDMPGEWVEMVESRRLLWLEQPKLIDNQDLTTAVAVAIDRPAPPLVMMDEFWKDRRWSVTLGLLALLSVGGWVWFARLLLAARRAPASRADAERAKAPAAGQPRPRLVRDDSLSRVIPEVQGVIVADIDANGGVHVETPVPGVPVSAPPRPQLTIPSGSLHRLQTIHRGGKGMRGSRVLDQARSQVLRELADRVRPVIGGGAGLQARGAAGRGGEKIPNMKSPAGWRKVGDEPQ